MVAPLRTTTISAPGFYGLNTMDSEVTLDAGYARIAENCIIDQSGRLGARKGWKYVAQDIVSVSSLTSSSTTATATATAHGLETGETVTIEGADQTEYNGDYEVTVVDADTFTYTFAGSATTPATGTITSTYHANLTGMHRFLDINGDEYFGAWSANGEFFIKDDDDLVSVTYNGDGKNGAGLIEEGNWQAATLNDAAVLVQRNYPPIYFNPTTGVLDDIKALSKGTPPEANAVLSAYGRVWMADTEDNRTTVYWSDLLDATEWRPTVGTVGSLDISGILINGNDEIVGLGAHNGRLIIFCKNNIIIMSDGDADNKYLTPANLQLVEVITNVGCISRDTIVNTGTDLLFLSESGVRSLGRTIQEKSQPMRDVSRNIRDTLVEEVQREGPDFSKIQAVYSDRFAFYLLLIPTENIVYCFDMRAPLQNGSARVTRWTGLTHTSWLSFDGTIYMTNTKGIAEYYGYLDNGSSYDMLYYTNYFNVNAPNQLKLVKNIAATVIGSTGQEFTAIIGTDYSDIYSRYPLIIKEGTVAEYAIAEYNTEAEYSGGALIDNVRVAAGGSGFVIQIGFESTINGGFLNIQQVDLYVKQGRLN